MQSVITTLRAGFVRVPNQTRPRLTLTAACVTLCSCIYPLFPRTPIYDDVVAIDGSNPGTDAHAHDHATDDATALSDANTDSPSGPPVLNDCLPSLYEDQSAPAADRTVYFGGTGPSRGNTYAPMCMIISPGQSVHFVGDLLAHPLSPGTGFEDTAAGSPNNPITRTASGQDITFSFPAPGVYPYFCETHVLDGMTGVVWVK